jgi:hypothetical protein
MTKTCKIITHQFFSILGLDQYLTHYWPFSNSQMTDQIGKSHMTQGAKTTFVADRFGCPNSALSLNQGWAQVPGGIYFNTPEITISAWIYPQQLGYWCRLIDFGNGGTKDTGFHKDAIVVPIANALTPHATFFIFSASPPITTIGTSNIVLGKWQFITATYNGTTTRVYVNGIQTASVTQTFTLPTVNRTQCFIGKSFNAPIGDGYSNSYIDDLRFYNKALTQAEILQLMNQPQNCEPTAPSAASSTSKKSLNFSSQE